MTERDQLNDHEKRISITEAMIPTVVKGLDEIKDMLKTGAGTACATHTAEIKDVKSSVKLIWGFIVPIIGWLLIISGLLVTVVGAAH